MKAKVDISKNIFKESPYIPDTLPPGLELRYLGSEDELIRDGIHSLKILGPWGLSNTLDHIYSELKCHEKNSLKVRKRKLPKHAQGLVMCVGDFWADVIILEISKLTKENNKFNSYIMKLIKWTHLFLVYLSTYAQWKLYIYFALCVYMSLLEMSILILFTIISNHLCIIYTSLQDSQHFTNIR